MEAEPNYKEHVTTTDIQEAFDRGDEVRKVI